MTTTSKLPALVDATIATLTAVLPAGFPVYDGPQKVDASVGSWCVVGGDGTLPQETRGGGLEQIWAGLGARARDEVVDIPCAFVSWIGDEIAYKTVRDMVCGNLALVELALLANITQSVANVLWCEAVKGELFYENWQQGIVARLPFVITAKTRI